MASTIGKVRAVFTASTSGLVAGVNSAAGSMRRLQSSVASLRTGMGALVAIQGAQLFGSIAATAGSYVRSLIAVGQQQAEVIDQQSKMAARLGMTYGEFANLATAADLAGVGTDALVAAATRADVAFVKAVNGSAQAQAAFSTLGLSLDELGQMSAAERFQAIGAAIGELPTEAQRAAAAVAIFGRAGAQLLPLFGSSAEAIHNAVREAEQLGPTLTNAQGRDVEAMNDAFSMVYESVNRVVRQVVAYLSPAVKAAADAFRNLIVPEDGTNIGKIIAESIISGARYLAKIGDWFIANMGSIWKYVVSVGKGWMETFKLAGQIASAFAMVGRALATAFLVIVRVAITPLMFVIENVARLASSIPGIGDTAAMAADTVAGFRDGLDQSIVDNANATAENFNAMLGDSGAAWGEAAAGPLLTGLDAAIAQANESAAAIDEAGRGAAKSVETAAMRTVEQKAVKGVDIRSKEGVDLIYELMRGGPKNVQERIAENTGRIADNTEDMGLDVESLDLAPAAGGF